MQTTAEIERNAVGAWGYRSYREHLAERFPGQVIRKLSLHAGFTCPNLDGKAGKGGCAYCNNRGFVPSASSGNDLLAQWNRGRSFLRKRHRRADAFIAYFQAFSNTYADFAELERVYGVLPDFLEECVGVSVSTRPDCLPDETLNLMESLARRCFLTLEIGLQSDRDDVLSSIGRGHDTRTFFDAIERAKNRGFEMCAHFILGLPGEGADAPERLGDLAASLPVQSVKIHNLHIMKGSRMYEDYKRGKIRPVHRDEYLDMLSRFLPRLRPDQSVQRLLADAPDDVLVGGSWCQDKQAFLDDLDDRLKLIGANHAKPRESLAKRPTMRVD